MRYHSEPLDLRLQRSLVLILLVGVNDNVVMPSRQSLTLTCLFLVLADTPFCFTTNNQGLLYYQNCSFFEKYTIALVTFALGAEGYH